MAGVVPEVPPEPEVPDDCDVPDVPAVELVPDDPGVVTEVPDVP